MHALTEFEISGSPPPWTVTGIDKFVVTALQRAQRESGDLPTHFRMTLCPWGERNAIGGTHAPVHAVIDPRLRIVHFTGCSKPYFIAFFIGDQAETRQQVAINHLPWSEHYAVEIKGSMIQMRFLACTEEPETEDPETMDARNLQDLFYKGILGDF